MDTLFKVLGFLCLMLAIGFGIIAILREDSFRLQVAIFLFLQGMYLTR